MSTRARRDARRATTRDDATTTRDDGAREDRDRGRGRGRARTRAEARERRERRARGATTRRARSNARLTARESRIEQVSAPEATASAGDVEVRLKARRAREAGRGTKRRRDR